MAPIMDSMVLDISHSAPAELYIGSVTTVFLQAQARTCFAGSRSRRYRIRELSMSLR